MAVYRRGNIYWADVTTASGRRIKRSLGTTDRLAAQEAHDKLKHDLWKIEKLGEKPLRTWEEAALRWLDEKVTKRTLQGDAEMIKRYTTIFRSRYIHELTADDIHRAAKRLSGGDVAYNRYLALMRAILKRAERHWQWIDRAPALILKPEAKRRIRWLTPQEAERLLGELPPHLSAMAGFSLQTGLRKSNVTGLKWSQIDMARRLVYVDGDDFKNGNDHSVPLNDSAVAIVRSQMGKNQEYVFAYKGSPIVQVNTKAWRAALVRAGIENFRWHDLRHTWASWLAQAGTPMHVLQELGGWESPEMVQRYAHLSKEHLAEYVGRLHGTNSPTSEAERKTG
ncbi:tyrosine-type recombinase/integrase [Chromobacterium haemolyticum]|uniref:tyrosine-type recombinase/integrase n=1 Tax=Chromobacterium TaxID=535 RepID=UPI00405734D8